MKLDVKWCLHHMQWCVTNKTDFCLYSDCEIVPALRFRREALGEKSISPSSAEIFLTSEVSR